MRIRLLLIILLCQVSCLWAQIPDSLRVGFVTCYPGSDIYELEGHNALRIYGRLGGRDVDLAVNYGLFDFNAPNFVYRFVKGETDYWCGVSDFQRFLASYVRQGRRVVMHPVELDSVQTARLVDIVNTNLLPGNQVYRYNYVKDNCATRPLRAIELAVADTLMMPAVLTDVSFRDVMRLYHRNYPWYQFGIDLALGSDIDYKINARELAFAPALLQQQLDATTAAGRKVFGAPVILNAGVEDSTLGPTPWYATPLFVFWVLFAVVAAFTVRDVVRLRVTRWLDAVLYGVFGIVGLVLTFLIFVSVHYASSPNWLYLWLNPLCLIVPIFIWLKKCKMIVISYQFINFALIFIMIAAWPWCPQSANAAFIPLIGCDILRSLSYLYINLKHQKLAK